MEYLAVAENGLGDYWITVAGTEKPFVRESFTTPGFCWECAVEIEETFEILQVDRAAATVGDGTDRGDSSGGSGEGAGDEVLG